MGAADHARKGGLGCQVMRALVLVMLNNYIAIFSIIKYKDMTTLVESKPYNLAS